MTGSKYTVEHTNFEKWSSFNRVEDLGSRLDLHQWGAGASLLLCRADRVERTKNTRKKHRTRAEANRFACLPHNLHSLCSYTYLAGCTLLAVL